MQDAYFAWLNSVNKISWLPPCFWSNLSESTFCKWLSSSLNAVYFLSPTYSCIYLHGQLSIYKHFCGYPWKGNANHSKLFPLMMKCEPCLMQHSDRSLSSYTKEITLLIRSQKCSTITNNYTHLYENI